MTLRLDNCVLRGVIRNDVPNTIDGWLQMSSAAPQPPILLSLVGNLPGRLAGQSLLLSPRLHLTTRGRCQSHRAGCIDSKSACSADAPSAQLRKIPARSPGMAPMGSSASTAAIASCSPTPVTQKRPPHGTATGLPAGIRLGQPFAAVPPHPHPFRQSAAGPGPTGQRSAGVADPAASAGPSGSRGRFLSHVPARQQSHRTAAADPRRPAAAALRTRTPPANFASAASLRQKTALSASRNSATGCHLPPSAGPKNREIR